MNENKYVENPNRPGEGINAKGQRVAMPAERTEAEAPASEVMSEAEIEAMRERAEGHSVEAETPAPIAPPLGGPDSAEDVAAAEAEAPAPEDTAPDSGPVAGDAAPSDDAPE